MSTLDPAASREGVIDVLGSAHADATVTVTYPASGVTIYATTRQDELYYKQLDVTNSSAAQYPALKVTAVLNDAGPNGEDVIAEDTRQAFIAQTPEAFVHDADGNLTADARWTYTWDGENRLVAMETAAAAVTAGVAKQKLEYGYDGQSRRVAKKVFSWSGNAWVLDAQTLYLYDGWNMIAELDGLASKAAARTYVWGLDLSGTLQGAGGVGGLLFTNSLTPSAETHAVCYDGNGNVIALVDIATGDQSGTYDYNAFGETVVLEGDAAEANPFRFSSKYTDAETGLLYYGRRYFSPSTGRWLSMDPVEERGGMNLYEFVGNNPINAVDPDGRKILISAGLRGGDGLITPIRFASSVMTGFRQVVGDSGTIGVERVTDGEGNVIAWQVVIRSENPDGKCSRCWEQLKQAINADYTIRVRYNYLMLDNGTADTSGAVRNVDVNPDNFIRIPEVKPGFVYSDRNRWDYETKKQPWGALLWHEAIGHATLGREHPGDQENQFGKANSSQVDPTIEIENMARECLRKNGFDVGDRYPKYYDIQ